MRTRCTRDNAFTGLEAAIVLIAFVVVAAVFSYVVLGAGFYTTQKSQEVVHTGVQSAGSNMQIVGNVYGVGTQGESIAMVNFTIGLAAGGTPIDFEKVVLVYSNATELETLEPIAGWQGTGVTPGKWAITSVQNPRGTSNSLLENGELFDICAYPTRGINKNDAFSLEVKPDIGASVSVRRTAPASINGVNILF
ncbi:archaellin/type IV pilin N-terminal domain-containing protein [Methanoregula sp.]|uniref:archaellin/type IV pilin N-terminal domain-containing protein n=1 Tax=Methanoregula sp. TaxID=2052170 RepID=UPI00356A4B61